MKILECKKSMDIKSYNSEETLLIFLKQWSLTIVEGENSLKFLQGQLTINMLNLLNDKYSFCAHCNYNGKVLSTFIIFCYNKGYAYIQRESVSNFQIQEIKKYAIFSNLSIYKSNKYYIFGIVGNQSRIILEKIFKWLPDKKQTIVQEREGLYILRIEQLYERFILVISVNNWNTLKDKILNYLKVGKESYWISLDIAMGSPIININCIDKFIPQEINLMQFKGIDFKKGCYQGQEIIAKTKFRNIDRKSMYWLLGESDRIPLSGEVIEIKNKNYWKKIGYVLIAVKVRREEIWVQAVLKSNLLYDSLFRIEKDPKKLFYIYKNFISTFT